MKWRLQGIIKIDLSVIFSVSLRCLDLLSNTRVLMYLMRQVLPGPVFLGAASSSSLGLDYGQQTTQTDLLDTTFYPYCIVYFRSESDITKVFFPALFSDRMRIIYDMANFKTSAYLPYCHVRQASEFVRLFISNVDPRSRLDSL